MIRDKLLAELDALNARIEAVEADVARQRAVVDDLHRQHLNAAEAQTVLTILQERASFYIAERDRLAARLRSVDAAPAADEG